jgi:hypothetical protein
MRVTLAPTAIQCCCARFIVVVFSHGDAVADILGTLTFFIIDRDRASGGEKCGDAETPGHTILSLTLSLFRWHGARYDDLGGHAELNNDIPVLNAPRLVRKKATECDWSAAADKP